MQLDDLINIDTGNPDETERKEKTHRLRLRFSQSILEEIHKRAEAIKRTPEEYLAMLVYSSGKTEKDKEIAEQKQMLESCRTTIERYRALLKEHCIPCDEFVEEEKA